MNLLDFMKAMAYSRLTKSRFGEIMHGDYSEEQKEEALKEMAAAGGYENLDE